MTRASLAVLKLALLAAITLSPTASAQAPVFSPGQDGGLPAGYDLVWADEFETEGLPDPSKWTYDTFRNPDGWWNGEAQYYSGPREKNARVEDGVLIIEAHREQLDRGEYPDWGGQNFTSTRLITAGLAEWTYGFIEARIKVPCGRGIWPAFWTLGAAPHDSWPLGGEIDIMEFVGYDPANVHGAIHTEAANHTRRNARMYDLALPDLCQAFHTYQLTWTPETILLGVDDRNYMRFDKDGSGEDAAWPFHRPQYLLLNVAVGGGWGGRFGIDDSIFPARMEVDYVRVYQQRTP